MSNMNRFYFKTNYHIIRLIKTIRRIYYGEERSSMARKPEPIIIESVEYDYVGTDNQFKNFLKNIIKDYLSEDKLQPEEEILKKSA